MTDTEALREMLATLVNGQAVVTVEAGGVRYTFIHASASVDIESMLDEMPPDSGDGTKLLRYLPGYRVRVKADAMYAGGDDHIIREVVA